MTVCIAAIYGNSCVIGASDRMASGGQMQYEIPQPKIWPVTKSIVAMISGESIIAYEIHQQVLEDIKACNKSDQAKHWKVKDVAELYGHYYFDRRLKHAEREVLIPIGLDLTSFGNQQKDMNPARAEQISEHIDKSLRAYNRDVIVSFILAGVDESGPHLYTVDGDLVSCYDEVGFASIGIGSWHADSHLCFSGQSKSDSLPPTVWRVYQAKKKAEVAPGVGEKTDMFWIRPELDPNFEEFPLMAIDTLDEYYKQYKKNLNSLDKKTQEGLDKYLDKPVQKT